MDIMMLYYSEVRVAMNQSPLEGDETTRRRYPVVHPIMDAPLCLQCQGLNLVFFDPKCPGCWDLARDASVAELFAILRQWVPQVQRSIWTISQEILCRNFHLDDRDGLTDMTLLHYACKACCDGIGSAEAALHLATFLLENRASPELRCRWTDMSALHYAAYFGALPIIRVLIKVTSGKDIESTCSEFDDGTALHIAASNGCLETTRCLLQLGADSHARDSRGRLPLMCVPDTPGGGTGDASPTDAAAAKLRQILRPESQFIRPKYPSQSYTDVSSRALLTSQGLEIGDRVCIGEAKTGTLRFCGATQFASGQWAGIELEEPEGKNNGTVDGVSYFECSPKHGIFTPLSKISKYGTPRSGTPKSLNGGTLAVSRGKIDVSHVSPRVDTGLRARSHSVASKLDNVDVGDRVIVAGHQVSRSGTVQYSGPTQFATGWWYGVELDNPHGKNDGSVNGDRYFTCSPRHGVFAHPSKLTRSEDVVKGSLVASSSSHV